MYNESLMQSPIASERKIKGEFVIPFSLGDEWRRYRARKKKERKKGREIER